MQLRQDLLVVGLEPPTTTNLMNEDKKPPIQTSKRCVWVHHTKKVCVLWERGNCESVHQPLPYHLVPPTCLKGMTILFTALATTC